VKWSEKPVGTDIFRSIEIEGTKSPMGKEREERFLLSLQQKRVHTQYDKKSQSGRSDSF